MKAVAVWPFHRALGSFTLSADTECSDNKMAHLFKWCTKETFLFCLKVESMLQGPGINVDRLE